MKAAGAEAAVCRDSLDPVLDQSVLDVVDLYIERGRLRSGRGRPLLVLGSLIFLLTVAVMSVGM